MSFQIEYSGKFKKDIKLAQRRGLNIELLKKVILMLEEHGKLTSNFKPHLLKGKYSGLWECHIQPDWLLVWDQNDTIKLITLIRTGTHSDLF